ncbi:hypothetical protein JD844_021106 [Phrynosoma platyrhinos]|nr:hypothetical protein JD844_021106 [Phrynosoma platyrhinos]
MEGGPCSSPPSPSLSAPFRLLRAFAACGAKGRRSCPWLCLLLPRFSRLPLRIQPLPASRLPPEAQPCEEEEERQSGSAPEASGVTVNDEVIKVFNDMKVRKSSTPEEIKKRKKAVLFCLSDDKKQIIVEEAKQILVGDIGDTVEDPYTSFVKLLPLNDCRYALYDATYETKESKKEDLVFIFWAPESAPLKSKMIYASSKDAIKKKFTGIKHEWQVNGLDDIKDRSTLGEKLGGNVVVSLEGKPL